MRGGSRSIPTISTILKEYLKSKRVPVSYNELLGEVKKKGVTSNLGI